jgi:hypothetical protein
MPFGGRGFWGTAWLHRYFSRTVGSPTVFSFLGRSSIRQIRWLDRKDDKGDICFGGDLS